MNSKFINDFRSKIVLNEEQKSIIVGLMLGDGCFETQNGGRTYRLKIEQTLKHKEYVDWLYAKLRNLVLAEPLPREKRIGNKIYDNYGFQTVSCGNFRFYAQQFYDQESRKKKIPKIISKLLTPLALAVWFMDDGQIKSNRHRALLINSQCFGKEDLELLRGALNNKFGIETGLKREKTGFRIYLLSATIQKFLDAINPFILSSMKYKLGRINNLPKE
ncbi:MAG: LAGLIDADG homing endonuclease [Parcubacteria group bacterium GW2011_GWF1_45_5]|nr:MAG: LAGLIDADG homing endonuclease [Parcubacteria group bacterium GW2011_GWF1_45_5]